MLVPDLYTSTCTPQLLAENVLLGKVVLDRRMLDAITDGCAELSVISEEALDILEAVYRACQVIHEALMRNEFVSFMEALGYSTSQHKAMRQPLPSSDMPNIKISTELLLDVMDTSVLGKGLYMISLYESDLRFMAKQRKDIGSSVWREALNTPYLTFSLEDATIVSS